MAERNGDGENCARKEERHEGEGEESEDSSADAATSRSAALTNGASVVEGESAENDPLDKDEGENSHDRKQIDDEAVTFETIINAFRFYKQHSLYKLKRAYDMFWYDFISPYSILPFHL